MASELAKLKTDLRRLRRELREVRDERDKYRHLAQEYRTWVNGKFEWFIDLMAESKRPNMAWLTKDTKDMESLRKETALFVIGGS